MELQTIATLKRAALAGRIDARIHAQIEGIVRKDTRDGKPFLEITLSDAEAKLILRAWHDGQAFTLCDGLAPGAFLEVSGEFSFGQAFGLEAKRWTCRELTDAEKGTLLSGPSELRAKQLADYECICSGVQSLQDPRLRALSELFLREHGDRFRRAAAARANHHARRGGLVEHVAQMLRSATAIAGDIPA